MGHEAALDHSPYSCLTSLPQRARALAGRRGPGRGPRDRPRQWGRGCYARRRPALHRRRRQRKLSVLYGYYALAQLLLGRGLLPVHLFTAVLCVPLTAFAASAAFRRDRRGVAAALPWLAYGASSSFAHDTARHQRRARDAAPRRLGAIAAAADERRAARSGPLVLAGLLPGLATLAKHVAALWPTPARLGRRCTPVRACARAPLRASSHSPPASRCRFSPRGSRSAATKRRGRLRVLAAHGAASSMPRTRSRRRVPRAMRPAVSCPGCSRRRRSSGRGPRAARILRREHGRGLTDGLVLLAVPPAIVGFRFFPHYFAHRPASALALAAATAPAVARWFERPRALRGPRVFAATLVIAVGFSRRQRLALVSATRASTARGDPVYRAVAKRLETDACFPGARLFVLGMGPRLLLRSRFMRWRAPRVSSFAVLAPRRVSRKLRNPATRTQRDCGAFASPSAEVRTGTGSMADLERISPGLHPRHVARRHPRVGPLPPRDYHAARAAGRRALRAHRRGRPGQRSTGGSAAAARLEGSGARGLTSRSWRNHGDVGSPRRRAVLDLEVAHELARRGALRHPAQGVTPRHEPVVVEPQRHGEHRQPASSRSSPRWRRVPASRLVRSSMSPRCFS